MYQVAESRTEWKQNPKNKVLHVPGEQQSGTEKGNPLWEKWTDQQIFILHL